MPSNKKVKPKKKVNTKKKVKSKRNVNPKKNEKPKTELNQFSDSLFRKILKEWIQRTGQETIKIDKDSAFILNRVVSQFLIHIAQTAAEESEENGSSKIKRSDVVAALKELNLERWISETKHNDKKKKKEKRKKSQKSKKK